MGSNEADRPTLGESFEFVWNGQRYVWPLDTLLPVANEIDAAAEAYVSPAHCVGAVALFLSAASRRGWSISPP